MRMMLRFLVLALLPVLLGASTTPSTDDEAYCRIYGIVYFVDKPQTAHHIVYIEEEESEANLLIFKEKNRLMADEEGIWYVTDNPVLAQHRVYITSNRQQADFTICYIEDRSFAGCQY